MIIPFIITLIALTTLAVWLDAVRAAVNSISGGYVRSLDDKKRTRAEKWLEQRKEYGFILRSLSFITTVLFTCYSYFHLIVRPFFNFKGESFEDLKRVLIFILILALYLILKETLGTIWISFYRYNLLKFSLPAIKVIRIFLKPYELILMHSFKKAEEREEETPEENKDSIAENEILSLVEGDDNGELEEDEIRMIKGVFDLNDKVVKEAMTPRVEVQAVESKSSIQEAISKFVETNLSRLPVYDDNIDNIIGVLFAKDFIDENKLKGDLKALLHKPLMVSENKELDKLLEEFKASQNHFAVVLDPYGGTSGIITIEDILEEIVGEILDEYDDINGEYEIKNMKDGELILDAKAAIHDINKTLDDTLLPEADDFDTIGGYIYTQISRIPVSGEVIQLDRYQAHILHADERSITKIKLIPNKSEEDKEQ